MYHGSDYYRKIQKFKSGKSGNLGPGIYFTSRKQIAEYYACKSGYTCARIYEAKIDINNPLIITSKDPACEILGEKVLKKRQKKNSYAIYWLTAADIKKIKEKGHDAIMWVFGNTIEISVLDPDIIEIVSVTKLREEKIS